MSIPGIGSSPEDVTTTTRAARPAGVVLEVTNEP